MYFSTILFYHNDFIELSFKPSNTVRINAIFSKLPELRRRMEALQLAIQMAAMYTYSEIIAVLVKSPNWTW